MITRSDKEEVHEKILNFSSIIQPYRTVQYAVSKCSINLICSSYMENILRADRIIS